MGLIVLVVVLAAVAGRIAGGPTGRPRPHRLNGIGLPAAATGIPLLEPFVDEVVPFSFPLAMTAAAALLVQFAVRNPWVPGVPLVALGLVANAAVIVVNGALPVSGTAAARAGLTAGEVRLDDDPRREALDDGTRLGWLGDRVAVPIPGRPEVGSAGDLAVAAGAGLFVFTAMSRRRPVFDPAGSGARVYSEHVG